MADIFAGTEPPRWLERMTEQKPGQLGRIFGELVGGLTESAEVAIQSASDKQAKGINTSWLKELPGSIQEGMFQARMDLQNPLWRMQVQQGQLDMAQKFWNIKNTQSEIDQRKVQMGQLFRDQEKWSNYMQGDGSTWEKRQANPIPSFETAQYQKMGYNQTIADDRSMQAKAVDEAIKARRERIRKIADSGVSGAAAAAAKYSALLGKPIWTDQMESDLNRDTATFEASALRQKEEEKRLAVEEKRKEQELTPQIKNINQINAWEADAAKAEAAGDTATATSLRGRARELREQLKGEGGAPETSQVKNIKQAAEWEKQAKAAAAAGDTETAQTLRDQAKELREQLKPPALPKEASAALKNREDYARQRLLLIQKAKTDPTYLGLKPAQKEELARQEKDAQVMFDNIQEEVRQATGGEPEPVYNAQNVPPPAQRRANVTKARTDRGLFIWNGTSWDRLK
jgi:hypothetical protein